MSLSAYIHIPFCKRKCSYCAFYSAQAGESKKDEYVSALVNQIMSSKDAGEKLKSVFLGGGTPSVLFPSHLTRILDALEVVFDVSDAEVTTELNPESVQNLLDCRLIKRFTRFSMGVQSFDDEELSLLGRLHSSNQAKEAFSALRNFGAENINIDLMLALPGKNHLQKLEKTLDIAVSLSPEHISAYILTPEKGTSLFEKYGQNNDDLSSEAYLMACEKLEKAGYEHYEISNFAKKGKRCVHNMCYWTQQKYLAFGPSACGFDGNRRYRIDCSTDEYVKNKGIVAPLLEEELNGTELLSERIMLSLRLSDGIDGETLNEIRRNKEKERFIESLVSSSLAKYNERGGISLTDRGFLVSNNIISRLM
ncbi:MAG: radical SAM family heme chaperone HemW [Clostridia bacterium]|nr:radical SAM family heme chaperone HemW [Clostridia bacterium]